MGLWRFLTTPRGPFVAKAEAREPATTARRSYAAAKTNRLRGGWLTQGYGPNQEIKVSLSILRARSRELEQNNGWGRKFFRMVRDNIIGENGMILQSRAVTRRGKADEAARNLIEAAWRVWTRNPDLDVAGWLTWWEIEQLIATAVARDGEAVLRWVDDPRAPMATCLQVLESDYIPDDYNALSANGNRIWMGVETDRYGRRVAYYLHTSHPGETMLPWVAHRGRFYERVPAEQIIHIYVTERAGQLRGVPWTASAILDAKMLAAFLDSMVDKARLEAAKMGFIEQDEDAVAYKGQGTDEAGAVIAEVEPGVIELLGPGQKFKALDFTATSDVSAFTKTVLRRVAGGLGVSYNALANDLEGVNFSSLRKGALEEQDMWKTMQAWLMRRLHMKVFDRWLDGALLTGSLGNLGFADRARLADADWQPRRWQWVDPTKEVGAQKTAVECGFKSRLQVIREQGFDPDQVDEEIAADEFIPQGAASGAANEPAPVTDEEGEEIGEVANG